MLTLDEISKATRQMTAYGEVYPRGTRTRRFPLEKQAEEAPEEAEDPSRVWDDGNKFYRHVGVVEASE